MEFTAREARLKPEFADMYPPLVAGMWETAAEMGAKVLLWQVQQQGTDALNSRAVRGLGGTGISGTTCMRRGAPVPIDFTRIGSFASLGSKG